MARQILDIGSNANDGTGDTLRAAMDKVNDNFAELYSVSIDNSIEISGNNISATRSNDDINIIPAGTGTVTITDLTIDNSINLTDNVISATQSNSDLVLRASGTGNIVLGDVTISDNTISTNASNANLELSAAGTGTVQLLKDTTVSGDLGVTGTLTVTGTATLSTSLTLASGATVTAILDEDTMTSNSATALATQQSIKAYVDSQVTAQDLDFQADSGGALSIDLDSETLTFTGGTGIDTSGSGNTVTFAIDSTVATLTGSQALSNKTLTSPVINTPTFGGTNTLTGSLTVDAVTISDNSISTNASNADLELSASGTGTVVLNSLSFPTADGTANQVLKTDGVGNLGWATVASGTFTHITNTDGTATITGSAVANIDAFSATTYRSAKYSVSMWDSTNNRAGIQDFFVTHDGSTAYITTMGVTSTGSDMATFSADISGGNVRVRATLASGDGTTFKFSKILFLV